MRRASARVSISSCGSIPAVGAAGDVAHVVGARAAGGEAEIGQAGEDFRREIGGDLADLQVGAGGDVGVAAAHFLRHVGQAAELQGVQDAAGACAAGT